MKKESTYLPLESKFPFKGLATSPPPNQLPSAFSPNLLNVHVRDGIIQRRAGYYKIGETLDGVVLGLTEFAPIGSADVLVVLTSEAQYYYDDTNDTFVDISREEVTTTAIDEVYSVAAGDADDVFVLSGADFTGQYIVGTQFTVTGSTGNDGTYTVDTSAFAASVTEIRTVEAIPDATIDGSLSVATRHPIASASGVSDTFTITGDVTPDFPIGQVFFCRDSANNNGTYIVVSSVFGGGNTTISVDAVPVTSGASGDLTLRDEITTAETDLIDYEPLVDVNSKRLLMTNGADGPLQWNGTTGSNPDHFVPWVPLFLNFTSCKWIKVFKEHLHLGHITSTTGEEPQLIAWSDSGDFEDFTNGNAGVQVLYELTTGIQALENLGDRMIIYSKDAIASGIFVGGTAIFQFETIIPQGTRLAGTNGIVSINVGHIYASEENFYLFDGTRGLRTLGDIIRTEYKSIKDQEFLHRTAILNDFSKRTLYISIPDSGSESATSSSVVYTMEYNAFDMDERAWSKEKYADSPRAFGFYTNTISFTWEDTDAETALATTLGNSPAALHWEDEIGPWGNEGEQVNFPVRCFGDGSGNVYLAAESVITDNGTEQVGHYDTADASVPEEFLSTYGRWGEIEFEASGSDATVSVSVVTEKGTTVVDAAVALTGVMSYYRLPMDLTARNLRIRFEFAGPFKLRWVKAWVKPAATR